MFGFVYDMSVVSVYLLCLFVAVRWSSTLNVCVVLQLMCSS